MTDQNIRTEEQVAAWLEYADMEADEQEENPCDSGWCGDSACWRCNPWGYPR